MTPEFTINANSDLDALVRDFRADQAELARREQLINGEAFRRTYETHRASEEKVKEQIKAIKKKAPRRAYGVGQAVPCSEGCARTARCRCGEGSETRTSRLLRIGECAVSGAGTPPY